MRQLYQQRGLNVLLVGRSAEKLAAVIAEFRQSENKSRLDSFVCDFANLDDAAVQKQVRDRLSSLQVSILVNCAGVSHEHPKFLAEESPEAIQSIIRTNCLAATVLTQAALPKMLSARFGIIWNVGSMAAELKSPLLAVYAGSKAYLRTFTEALQGELVGSNVTAELLNTYFVVLFNASFPLLLPCSMLGRPQR